ncbi:MAG TPA: alpha/beta fold hydrolase [Propionibacteriaceae bacterium]|nr:alpha/beta fold hydrolase [Propionibacteriaceae bacterium]
MNDPAIHHRDVGSGPAPVVFLHGLFGQGKNFTQIARDLSDLATSRLVDLPNHGRSAWTEVFDYDLFADALVATVAAHARALGRRGVTLVGHSLGGKVAMRFALRHPDLVEQLVVVDIAPVAAGVHGSFDHILAGLRAVPLDRLTSRDQADAALAAHVDLPSVRAFLLQNLRHDHHEWHWRMNLDLLEAGIDEVGGWPEISASYPGPVTWVAGARSDYVRPEYAPAMRALFPRVRLVTIKDAGHWVHSDQPRVFTSLLRHVLSDPAATSLSPG